MKRMKKLKLALLICAYAACAPKVETIELKKPMTPELLSKDVSLQKLYSRPFASVSFALKNLNLNESINQESIQNLFEIGLQLDDQNASEKATEDLQKFKSKNSYIQKNFQDSYYLQLVEEQTRSKIKNSVSALEKQILSDTEKIISMIPQIAKQQLTPLTKDSTLTDQLSATNQFLNQLVQTLQKKNIYPELKEKIVENLNTQSASFIQKVNSFNDEYNKVNWLSEKLKVLNLKLSELQIELDLETISSLNSGQQLAVSIDQISDPATALQTLALTWQILNVEERIQYFQTVNEKLYELFNKKDEKDIECLIQGNCKGLISKLVLKMGVYPALEDYGIQKVKTDINQAAINFLNQKISSIAFTKIQQLPLTIQNEIQTSVEKNLSGLQSFQKNFKKSLARGLGQTLKTEKIDLYLKNKNLQLGDQVLMMTNELYSLPYTSNKQKQQFNLMENVLSLVDFSNQKKYLLKNGITEYLKTIPALFLLSEIDTATNAESKNILKISDQAQTLKFLSLMISATADWKKGPYQSGLTELTAQNLISDFNSDQLNDKVFPQLELLNICFSMTAQVLKQFQSEKSLIYLINNQNLRIPIFLYLSDKNPTTVALAAASDQINNRILDTAKAKDLALLIEALSQFSVATSGFVNSQSTLLQQSEIQNQIFAAQKNIDLLILTLANFISSQMIGPDHFIADSYDFETQILSENYGLENQVHAIHALTLAYERTGIDLYLFSAKEIYYALNSKFYDPEIKFYKSNLNMASTDSNRRDDVTKTLNHLLPLRKYLSLTSQIQFDRIFENWYVATLL
jgi:hypothetical protein